MIDHKIVQFAFEQKRFSRKIAKNSKTVKNNNKNITSSRETKSRPSIEQTKLYTCKPMHARARVCVCAFVCVCECVFFYCWSLCLHMHGQLFIFMCKLCFGHFDMYLYMCVYVRGWHWFVLLVAVHNLSVIMKILVCCDIPHGTLISA